MAKLQNVLDLKTENRAGIPELLYYTRFQVWEL